MGSVYRRPDSPFWWVWFLDARGRRKAASTGTTDEAAARRRLKQIERQVAAQREAGADTGPLTLERYAKAWLKRREESGNFPAWHKDEARWNRYIAPRPFTKLLLGEVRPSHLREHMVWLRGQKSRHGRPMAPRSMLRVYGLLRVMFADAIADELITGTPCVLRARRKELPPNADKSPTWRAGAVYSRAEVEALISSTDIPVWRRITYGALFLTGMRFGEMADRRFSDYEPDREPLGRLLVHSSWNSELQVSKSTKTGQPREVPVHRTLAKMLAQWKLSGWADTLGRKPRADDLMFPNSVGEHQHASNTLKDLKGDLAALGLRDRSVHNMRRSFISLAMGDGALKETLRFVTHDSDEDVFDTYNTPPWDALCREVGKLRVSLRGPVTVELRRRTRRGKSND